MRTPKDYTNNLKNKIITVNMLANCLYSVNKRAKNCRDKEREYRASRYDYYDTEEIYRKQKEIYYDMKDTLLSLCKPKCIHMESSVRKIKIYDYEPEYDQNYEIIRSGSYYDKETGDYVYFDVILEPYEKFYLLYEIGGYSFHTPIDEDEVKNYPELEIKDIGPLVTFGRNIDNLISVQFVKKVIALIKSGDYIFDESALN